MQVLLYIKINYFDIILHLALHKTMPQGKLPNKISVLKYLAKHSLNEFTELERGYIYKVIGLKPNKTSQPKTSKYFLSNRRIPNIKDHFTNTQLLILEAAKHYKPIPITITQIIDYIKAVTGRSVDRAFISKSLTKLVNQEWVLKMDYKEAQHYISTQYIEE